MNRLLSSQLARLRFGQTITLGRFSPSFWFDRLCVQQRDEAGNGFDMDKTLTYLRAENEPSLASGRRSNPKCGTGKL